MKVQRLPFKSGGKLLRVNSKSFVLDLPVEILFREGELDEPMRGISG
jgi:hypothetical protein